MQTRPRLLPDLRPLHVWGGMSRRVEVFRDGAVHVRRKKCKTCIFHPGNRMLLGRGRVSGMVREANANDSCIPCHEDMDTKTPAVCAGYFKIHNSLLQVAERLELIELV